MSRTTSGTPGLTRRRVLVGTAVLSAAGLIGGGLAVASAAASSPVIEHVYAVESDTAPAAGAAGGGNTTVRLTGTDLDKVTSVWFGNVSASRFIVESSKLIYVTPPAVEDATDSTTFNVDVKANAKATSRTASTADDYTYTAGPVVTSTTVSADAKTVKIVGSQLGGATTTVSIGGVAAKLTASKATAPVTQSQTELNVTAPNLTGGQYDIALFTPKGSTIFRNGYGAVPKITKLAPAATPTATVTGGSDLGGDPLLVTGTGFAGAKSVVVGAASASFTVVSDTVIRVVTPAASAAKATPTVGTGATTYAPVSVKVVSALDLPSAVKPFKYVPLPTVTSVDVVKGKISATGTIVTLTGTNLYGVTAVKVGSSLTDSKTVTAAKATDQGTANGTTWKVKIPAAKLGTVAGPTTIWVTTATGTGRLLNGFTWE